MLLKSIFLVFILMSPASEAGIGRKVVRTAAAAAALFFCGGCEKLNAKEETDALSAVNTLYNTENVTLLAQNLELQAVAVQPSNFFFHGYVLKVLVNPNGKENYKLYQKVGSELRDLEIVTVEKSTQQYKVRSNNESGGAVEIIFTPDKDNY